MAKFLCRRRSQEHCGAHRLHLRHEPHRGALRALRCAFRPRVSGWPGTNWAALLYELGFARLQTQKIKDLKKETMECRASSPGWMDHESIPPPVITSSSEVQIRFGSEASEITGCPKPQQLLLELPACFDSDSASAISDFASRDFALRPRP